MINRLITLAAALTLATGLPAVTISFSPASQTIALGSTTTVDVAISGLAVNQVIGGFDLTVLSDSALVRNTAIKFLDPLGDPASELTGSNLAIGSANASEVSFESNATLAGLQSGTFSIFRITYLALGVGTSALDFALTPTDLSDGDGNLLPSNSLTLNNGSITVTGSPEPATLALSSLGVIFAVVLHRRRSTVKP